MKNFIIKEKKHKWTKMVVIFAILALQIIIITNNSYAETYTNDSKWDNTKVPNPKNYVSEPDAGLADYENAPIDVNYKNGLILDDESEPLKRTDIVCSNKLKVENSLVDDTYEIRIPYEDKDNEYDVEEEVKATYSKIGKMKIGTAQVDIGCTIIFRYFRIYSKNQRNEIVRLRINKNYKQGFHYAGMASIQVNYQFFRKDTMEIVPLHDTYFTVNSLTWNEGVAYIDDNYYKNYSAYINWNDYAEIQNNKKKKYITTEIITYGSGKYKTHRGHGHATQNVRNEIESGKRVDKYYGNSEITWNNLDNYLLFDDWMGLNKRVNKNKNNDGNVPPYGTYDDETQSKDFDKGSVAFLLNDPAKTSYKFAYSTQFKAQTGKDGSKWHECWIAHSTIPLGLPKVEDPVKKSNKKQVVKGATFTYRISQKLHENNEGALRKYDHYTQLRLEDTLPKEVNFLGTRIIIKNKNGSTIYNATYNANADNANGTFKITNNTGQDKITYDFKNSYLNNLPLAGQTLIWEIDCKVKPNVNKDIKKIENQAITNLGRVKYKSNKITIDIISPVLGNTITKTAIGKAGTSFQNPNCITEKDDTIHYTIKYTPTIQNYIGSATIILEDSLPYPLDEQKTSQEVLKYYNHDNNNPKLTWTVSYNDINSEPSYNASGDPVGTPNAWTKIITREIDIVYNIPKSALAFGQNNRDSVLQIENTAKGITNLESGENVNAEAKYTINLDKRMKITIQKNWKDNGTEADIINRQNLKWISFVLYANDSESYRKVLKTNSEIQSFKKEDLYMMAKYDQNGNRIKYSLIEYVGGNDNLLGTRAKETTKKKVTGLDKLYYYTDKYSEEEGIYKFKFDDNSDGQQTHQILTATNTKTSININGNVWKDANKNGERETSESNYPAIEVKLYVSTYPNGKNAQINEYRKVLTDSNGNYSFNDLPWNGTYKIVFAYNGQIYEAITHKNNGNDDMENFSSGISNVKENENERNALNARFSTISSYPSNYGDNKTAFGLRQKIDAYINNQPSYITLEQILGELQYRFPEISYISYDDAQYEQAINNILETYMVNTETSNQIKQYMKDCIMHASSKSTYLESENVREGINTIQYIDCALGLRPQNNLNLVKDVYSIRSIINGSDEQNILNKKPQIHSVEQRAQNEYYTNVLSPENKPENVYERVIQRADYSYQNKATPTLNLQLFITYKITVSNIGEINPVSINSIIDYYDSDFLEFCTIGKLYENLPEFDVTKLQFNIEDKTINGAKYQYNKLSIKSNQATSITELPVSNSFSIYVVFKVKNDQATGRIKLRDVVNNIAEIGGYTTSGGYVDINSTPGNLTENKLDSYGNLQYNLESNNVEDDIDQIKIRVRLANIGDETRHISGYVFEDERVITDKNLKTTLGNGLRDNNETLIDGVTVQLIQIEPEVDENGFPTGNFTKTKLVDPYRYKMYTGESPIDVGDYYSGIRHSVIMYDTETQDGQYLPSKQLKKGQYMFDSLPPGYYYVVFKYGNSDRTVLTNNANSEVYKATGRSGMNAKSYNGQDYKTTIYQKGIDQSKEWYNVNGLLDNELNEISYKTNSLGIPSTPDGKNLINSAMIYSDLGEASKINASDVMDAYSIRTRVNDYSRKLNNDKEETLWAAEKLDTYSTNRKQNQNEKINELIDNTQMSAKTGFMKIDSVLNNAISSSVDCGLVERPKSQIVLNKEIENMKIILHNNTILFNTSQTVNNFYFSKHFRHNLDYKNYRIDEATIKINKDMDENESLEILLGHLDEELLNDSKLVVNYKITARNMGEVDFNDIKYYYTGIEDAPEDNVSTAKVTKLIDYLNNSLKYNSDMQEKNSEWIAESAENLINNKLVSKQYRESLKTYNVLLVSQGIKDAKLKPYIFNQRESEKSVGLVVESILATVNDANSLTYNNMAEIIEIENDQGRKSAFTKEGNQEIINQKLKSNAIIGNSQEDRKKPSEIDADSSQKIVLLPPTGNDTNYLILTGEIIFATGLIVIAVMLIIKAKKIIS